MYLKEWLPKWLENYIKPSAKEKTIFYYTIIIEKHLVPHLGEYELDELSPLIIQQFVTEIMQSGNLITGEGLSANTVNSIITVLQNALRQAFQLGFLSEYTTDKVKRPKPKERNVECFTSAEQKQIEKAVLGDRRVKMFGVILCLYTGLRIGELLALEWTDIDFSKGELSVNKSCHDSKKDGKYYRMVDAPKTNTSIRIIPIPRQMIPMLRETKKKNHSKYVVGNGDKVISVRSYQYSFSGLLKSLEIPHRGFHSLRHTFATRALECGMDVKTLSEILGHKNSNVTLNRYAHSLLSHKHDMMNRLGKLL